MIVDVSMPKLNGIEAVRLIRKHLPKVKVIMLTMHPDPAYARAAFSAAEQGCALKHEAIEEPARRRSGFERRAVHLGGALDRAASYRLADSQTFGEVECGRGIYSAEDRYLSAIDESYPRAPTSVSQPAEAFRLLAENVSHLVWVVRPDGRLDYANRRWIEHTGVDPEIGDVSWDQAVHPDDLPTWNDRSNASVIGGEAVEARLRLRSADGCYRWFSVRTVPLTERSGLPGGWLGTCIDLDGQRTERKEELFEDVASLAVKQGGPADKESRSVEPTLAPACEDLGNQPASEVIEVEKLSEVRAATEALADSEAKLNTIVERVPVGIGLADSAGRVLSLNPAALRLHGFASLHEMPAHLEGYLELFELSYPDGRSMPPEEWPLARAMRGEHVKDYQVLLRRRSSREPRIVSYDSAPMAGGSGTQQILFVMHDITDWKRADDLLRRSERQMSLVINTAPVLIAHCDAERRFQFVNRSYAERFQLTPEEIVGKSIPEVLGETAYEAVSPHIEEVLAGCPVEFETEVQIPSLGRRFVHVTYSPDLDADAGVRGFVAIVNDISERKRAEDTLRESEKRFRLMADAAPVLIWLSDFQKRGVYFNQRWLDFTGRSMAQELGVGWLENVHPDDQERLNTTCLRAFRERRPFRAKFRLRRADGQYRWVLDQGVPRFAGQGELAGYIGSCVDITELKEAEDKLREADRRKTEFLAMLAHELRNPLAPIRTGVELMGLLGDDPAKVKEIRRAMERQIRQLIALVDDLLDISRISTGKLALRRSRVNLDYVIQTAVESASTLIAEKGHELILNVPEETIELEADPHRLAQIVANLLNNAAKYTPAAGRIWLSAWKQGCDLAVSVKDTGVGIPPAFQESIFDLFAQIHPSPDAGSSNLGIGLSLVKSLVDMHGGTIEVRSGEADEGSEFMVRLPVAVAPAMEKPAISTSGGPAATAPKRRVLVVDDNRTAADMLAMLVERLGNYVRTAYDGASAVSSASEFKPDVILMDLSMPRVDGYEAARQIRRQPWARAAMLIALSGWGLDDHRKRTREAGFDRHWIKPVDASALRELLADPERQR